MCCVCVCGEDGCRQIEICILDGLDERGAPPRHTNCIKTLITLTVVPKCTHFLESYFEVIVLGRIYPMLC